MQSNELMSMSYGGDGGGRRPGGARAAGACDWPDAGYSVFLLVAAFVRQLSPSDFG